MSFLQWSRFAPLFSGLPGFPAVSVPVPAGTRQAEGHSCNPQAYRVPEPAARRCNSRTRTHWSDVFHVLSNCMSTPSFVRAYLVCEGPPFSRWAPLPCCCLKYFSYFSAFSMLCVPPQTPPPAAMSENLLETPGPWLTDPVSGQWVKLGGWGQGQDVWSAQNPIKKEATKIRCEFQTQWLVRQHPQKACVLNNLKCK